MGTITPCMSGHLKNRLFWYKPSCSPTANVTKYQSILQEVCEEEYNVIDAVIIYTRVHVVLHLSDMEYMQATLIEMQQLVNPSCLSPLTA